MSLYVGLMSGTSLDAIDAALVEIGTDNIRLVDAISYPLDPHLRDQLLTLAQGGSSDEIELMGTCDNLLGHHFGDAVNQLLKQCGVQPQQISAIGSHGQTIRHRPDIKNAFTLQIGDPTHIVEHTGITTVCDFRRRDMAAGGQGAPLVPAFHHAMFAHPQINRCIVNIGGMANLTYLPAEPTEMISGFDTGPGNVLMDSWSQTKTNKTYDERGDWARGGNLIDELLNKLLDDDYFHRTPPKSTGREHFNLDWLQSQISDLHRELYPGDIQKTLCALTATTITNALQQHYPKTQEVIVCGGGSHNQLLLEMMQEQLQQRVYLSNELGLDPDWVEATAFAWLAYCAINRQPANAPSVTGARRRVILGAIYPA